MNADTMQPRLNLNGTAARSLIEDRMAVLNAIEALMTAMQQTGPHGRDYIGDADAFGHARKVYCDRFNLLDKLRNDVTDEALAIQTAAA